MSWTDPCLDCHNPRYACECKIEPNSKEQLDQIERDEFLRKQGEEICKKEGHIWEYVFIVHQCKRCKLLTDY